jgi:hypothetical protein
VTKMTKVSSALYVEVCLRRFVFDIQPDPDSTITTGVTHLMHVSMQQHGIYFIHFSSLMRFRDSRPPSDRKSSKGIHRFLWRQQSRQAILVAIFLLNDH